MVLERNALHTQILKTKEEVGTFIERYLRPHLPYSLPLLRRCQFHCSQEQPHAPGEVWVASLDPHGDDSGSTLESAFIAAHIDLRNSGQTQVWAYASWELEFSKRADAYEAVQSDSRYSIYQTLFYSLIDHLKTNHIPQLDNEAPPEWHWLKNSGKIVTDPFSKHKVLFGTLAETLWPLLDNYGGRGFKKSTSREDRPYLKYVLLKYVAGTEEQSLRRSLHAPDGLHFARMQKEHLQTIVDRTNIPRTIETLSQLHNVALFNEKDIPVAWGLLGRDASLTSLHTEPEYRRKGLAELVARKLLADQVDVFEEATSETETSVVWSHADVSTENMASRKTLEKLSGEVKWKVAWIEIDLSDD